MNGRRIGSQLKSNGATVVAGSRNGLFLRSAIADCVQKSERIPSQTLKHYQIFKGLSPQGLAEWRSEMPAGELVAGTRFQIPLEGLRLFERLKGDIGLEFPGRILRRSLASVPAIMRGKAPLQVRGRSDIPLLRVVETAKDIGVVHKGSIAENRW